jgi:hypothetical protein
VSVRRVLIVLAVVLGVLTTAACNATSRSSRCVNGVCQISLTGEQTVEVEFGAFERDLRVGPIEPGAVTVSARGDQARLAVGEAGPVGGLTVRVLSVSGGDVGLEVRRA